MPNMTLLRLGDLNLTYKIIETMENNGFINGKYDVIDGYPNELDLKSIHRWPTVSVEIDSMFGRNVELGSKQWPGCSIAIDVFAKTDSQRDDISYLLWNALNEEQFTLYDFNDGFPSTSGGVSYTGLSDVGDWAVEQMTVVTLSPAGSDIDGEQHHSLIDGVLLLPNI